MNNQQLLQYYAGLLILQYAGLPKFQQFIQLVANQSTCDGLFLELQNCFVLNEAVGVQLTMIGNLLGVPRTVFGINPYATYFNFTRASGTPASIGFNRATTPVDPDYFLRAQVNSSYTMTDFELLNVIRLKIIYNYTYSSFRALKNALYYYFNGNIDIKSLANSYAYFNFTRATSVPPSNGYNRATTPSDSFNFQRASDFKNSIMTINYYVKQPYYTTMQIAKYLNIVPHSSGVNQIINYI